MLWFRSASSSACTLPVSSSSRRQLRKTSRSMGFPLRVADLARVSGRFRRPGRYLRCRSRRPGWRGSARGLRVLSGLLPRQRPSRMDEAARAAVERELRQLDRAHGGADPRGTGPPSRAGRSPAERRGSSIRRRQSGRTARPAGRLRGRRAAGWPPAAHARSADAARLAPAQCDRQVRRTDSPAGPGAVPVDRLAAARLSAALAREGRSRNRARPEETTSGAPRRSKTTTSPISSQCSATSNPAASVFGPRCSCSGFSTIRRAISSTAVI